MTRAAANASSAEFATVQLGHAAQQGRGLRRRLGQDGQGVGAQGLDLGQSLLTGLQPRLGDQGFDLGGGEGSLGRLPGRGAQHGAVGPELGVEGEGDGVGGLGAHVSRSTRRRRPGRPA